MKHILIIIPLLLVSCYTPFAVSNQFRVTEIESKEHECMYILEYSIDKSTKSVYHIGIIDKCGKFSINDTLEVVKTEK